MNSDLSISTVVLSALVSIATGYIGALLSAGRLRRQDARVYGLALLAEVKSIYRSLGRYHTRVGSVRGARLAGITDGRAALSLWRQDLSVFTANSGKIGLFSARTAVELIEFYHRVRWLEAHSEALNTTVPAEEIALSTWLEEQERGVTLARQHARYLSRLLHHEIPVSTAELVARIRRGHRRRVRLRPRRSFFAGGQQ